MHELKLRSRIGTIALSNFDAGRTAIEKGA